MGRGVSGIFGGIFPALEIGFSLVRGERVLEVRQFGLGFSRENLSIKLSRVLEWFVDHWGKFERAIPKSNRPQRI